MRRVIGTLRSSEITSIPCIVIVIIPFRYFNIFCLCFLIYFNLLLLFLLITFFHLRIFFDLHFLIQRSARTNSYLTSILTILISTTTTLSITLAIAQFHIYIQQLRDCTFRWFLRCYCMQFFLHLIDFIAHEYFLSYHS